MEYNRPEQPKVVIFRNPVVAIMWYNFFLFDDIHNIPPSRAA